MDGPAHEGGPVVPAERLVHRERLLRDLRTQGEEAGITVVVAPDGFGKTTLLVQRVAEVRSCIERGSARMLDLEGSTRCRRMSRSSDCRRISIPA